MSITVNTASLFCFAVCLLTALRLSVPANDTPDAPSVTRTVLVLCYHRVFIDRLVQGTSVVVGADRGKRGEPSVFAEGGFRKASGRRRQALPGLSSTQHRSVGPHHQTLQEAGRRHLPMQPFRFHHSSQVHDTERHRSASLASRGHRGDAPLLSPLYILRNPGYASLTVLD